MIRINLKLFMRKKLNYLKLKLTRFIDNKKY